ncbi:long tail fiber protein distal subunit [Serratia phage 92A1]|nr:long tail fiber protein distal subunit [Serratia phage 92A1]
MAKLNPNTIPSIQFFRTNTAGRSPAAGDLKEGELALNLADGQLFAKGTTTIAKVGLPSAADAITSYRITAKELVSTGATNVGGSLIIGRAGIISTISFGDSEIYSNADGKLVMNAKTQESLETDVIFLRPQTNSSTNQVAINGHGRLTAEHALIKGDITVNGVARTSGLNVSGTSTFGGLVNLNNNVVVNATGTFTVNSAAAFNGITNFNKVVNLVDEVYLSKTLNVKGKSFLNGAASISGGLEISGNTVSNGAMTVRTDFNITPANDTSNSHIWFRTSTGAERNIIYSDKDANLSFRPWGRVDDTFYMYNDGNFSSRLISARGIPGRAHTFAGGVQIHRRNDGAGLSFHGANDEGGGKFYNPLIWANVSTGGPAGSIGFREQPNEWHGFQIYTRGGDTTFRSGGHIYTNGNVVANNVQITSDIRFKRGLKLIESALDKVDALSGSTYEVHNKVADTWTKSAGLIAQDVLKVFPAAVNTDDPEHYKLDYQSIVGLLVNAVKELRHEVKQLRGE